jgi:hypothetical protein
MATTAEDEAISAKALLRARLGRPPWLRGVGLVFEDGQFFLRVNVASSAHGAAELIPRSVGGVRVVVAEVPEVLAAIGGARRR